jgi:hypothetical protein
VFAVGTLEPGQGLDVVFDAARVAGQAWQLVLAGALGDHGVGDRGSPTPFPGVGDRGSPTPFPGVGGSAR